LTFHNIERQNISIVYLDLIKKKAADFGIKAYKRTRAVAPTPQKIIAAVTSRGWRVKRKAGAWPKQAGDKPGDALRRMQASVIGTRIHRIGYQATGWLPALRLSNRKGETRIKLVHAPRGKVEFIGIGSARSQIIISNSTPGITQTDDAHGIVEGALNDVSEDIEKYVFPRLDRL